MIGRDKLGRVNISDLGHVHKSGVRGETMRLRVILKKVSS